MEKHTANNVDPDQTPHNVASDLGLHCLPMIRYQFPAKNGLHLFRHVVKSDFLESLHAIVSKVKVIL